MGFKEWKKKRAKTKRDKWEEDSLTPEQRETVGFDKKKKGVTLSDLMDFLTLLENRLNRLEDRIYVGNSKSTKQLWKIIQDRNGQTVWYKQGLISYVSKVYRINEVFAFDVIIDGQNIVLSADTSEETEQMKLDILNVERVEEFDSEQQQEMFPEEKGTRKVFNKQNKA